MVRPAGVAPAVVAAVALVALAGCSGGSDPTPAAPLPSPTPLAELDTTGLDVQRASFCARVAPAVVEDALGAEADDTQEWVNGRRAEVADGVTDVAHEFGCRWSAADGTTATGWVFAPPVTPREARGLVRAAAAVDGCQPVPGAPAFGSPSVAVRCDDGTTAFHGLFGDAWLSCSLTAATSVAPDPDAAGLWCATVAQAASG